VNFGRHSQSRRAEGALPTQYGGPLFVPHYVAPAGPGFEIGVGDNVVHQLMHVDGFLHFGELAGFQAKQFEKVANQRIDAFNFRLNPQN
jgi:hypothetical protein